MIWVTEGSSTWRNKKKNHFQVESWVCPKRFVSWWSAAWSSLDAAVLFTSWWTLIYFSSNHNIKGNRVLTITAFISTNSYNRRINSLNCVEKRFITMTHMALKHDSLSKVCCLNLCAPVLFLNSFPGTWTPRSLWEHRICEEVKLRPSSQPSKKNLLKRGEKKWTKSRKPSANFICTVQF